METQQNEQAWLKYYQSGALGKKPTNREVFLARKAFLAGRESAQHSVQRTAWSLANFSGLQVPAAANAIR